jgi:hypothetical protein
VVYTSALGGRNRRAVDEGRSASLSTEGPQTEAGRREKTPETNVVRLPRDWLGPREELVPFGPRADATAAEVVGSAGAPPSANDFWGEQSGELQRALQGPEPVGAQDEGAFPDGGHLTPAGEPGRADSAEPGRETHPYGGFLDHASFTRRWITRLGWPWTLRGGGPRAAPAALAAMVAAVVGILVITSGSGAPAPAPARAPTNAQGSSLGAALAADAARQRTQLDRRSQSAPRLAERHLSTAHAHHQRPVHRAHTASTGQVAAGARGGIGSAASSYGSQTGGGTAPVQSPASAAPPAASSAPATSSAASDQGSGSGATHPYGLGGTVGPGHSPNG